MNLVVILKAINTLLTYGPLIEPLLEKARQWVKEGKKEVTTEDIQELIAYGKQKGTDYFEPSTPPRT